MNDLYKLKGDLNPRLIKNLTLYLVEEKFTYDDLINNTSLFSKTEKTIIQFLNNELSFESVGSVFEIIGCKLNLITYDKQKNIFEKIDFFEKFVENFIIAAKQSFLDKDGFILLHLLSNHWLYNNGFSLMVFNPYIIVNIKEMIDKNVQSEFLRQTIFRYYLYSLAKNKKNIFLPTDDVVNKLIAVKDVLKLQYKVNKLFIYGSYSRNQQTEYSDLDVLIESDKDMSIAEAIAIKDFLRTILKIKVDIAIDDSFIKGNLLEVF